MECINVINKDVVKEELWKMFETSYRMINLKNVVWWKMLKDVGVVKDVVGLKDVGGFGQQ